MATNPDSPAAKAYHDWLTADPEPGWYDPGEGHRIQTAFMAGFRAGVIYLASQLAQAMTADMQIDRLIADLRPEAAEQAPPPGPSAS